VLSLVHKHVDHSVIAVVQAYLYDIRSGSYLHKLTGHTDTVSAVAFHPQFPQVNTLCAFSFTCLSLCFVFSYPTLHTVIWTVEVKVKVKVNVNLYSASS